MTDGVHYTFTTIDVAKHATPLAVFAFAQGNGAVHIWINEIKGEDSKGGQNFSKETLDACSLPACRFLPDARHRRAGCRPNP
jgi:hypothetical protein